MCPISQNNIANKAKVFLLIPNKDGEKHLKYSLPSFLKSTYPNLHIIVIDDYSTDGSVEFLRSNYEMIRIIEQSSNKGFAGTVNSGIRSALNSNADYIAICNNDILVPPNWIELSIDVFNKDASTGIVGYSEVAREQKDFFEKLDFSKLSVEFHEVKSKYGFGFCYLCSSNIFRHVGLYDEDYYMYGEDNDFFLRTMMTGYSIIKTNIPVWHYGEGTRWASHLRLAWFCYRNAMRCAIKNESPLSALKVFLSLLNQGCNPFLNAKKLSPRSKRLRPYNIFFNVAIYLVAILWNLVYLPKTLKARSIVKKKIRKRTCNL
jgi:hypothetical protein